MTKGILDVNLYEVYSRFSSSYFIENNSLKPDLTLCFFKAKFRYTLYKQAIVRKHFYLTNFYLKGSLVYNNIIDIIDL